MTDYSLAIFDRQDYTGVDIMKFFMALCVIAIHVNSAECVTTHWPMAIEWLINQAVPFFFICSGFLLAKKLEKIDDRNEHITTIRRRAVTIFRIFVCWLLIYLPITIYVNLNNDISFTKDLINYFGRIIVSGESQYAYPLWFLYSMGIVLMAYSLLYKVKNIEYKLLALFAIVLALNNFISVNESIAGNLGKWFALLTSRSLGGGIYIMSGIILYRGHRLPRPATSIVLVVASVILFCLKLPYWELCGGIAFFTTAIYASRLLTKPTRRYRKMSIWIYYTHMLVIFAYIVWHGFNGTSATASGLYIATVFPVVVISAILTRLQDVREFKFLRYLIS